MKTKLHFLVLLFVIIPLLGFSQCPNSPIVLTTQAEVDSFSSNYPGCVDLNNTLTISGDDITNLTPLSILQSFDALSIKDNPLLTSLAGLENISDFNNLNAIDGPLIIEISNNSLLEDISALSSVNQISTDYAAIIEDNPSLLSLLGLEWIQSTGDIFKVENNDSLTNLSGLDNLVSAEALLITGNDSLVNLVGLESLEGTAGMEISNNINLLNFTGLSSLLSSPLNILNNSSLVSFDGLNPSMNTATLTISNNIALIDISALSNVSIIFISNISDNSSLSLCSIPSICEYVETNPNTITVSNNAVGCENEVELSLSCGIIPSNDECENAIPLVIGETIVAYNTLSTISSQTPSCNDINRLDVWFTVNSGSFNNLDIIAEAGFYIQLWVGECTNLTQVPNACAENTLMDISVSMNTNYFLQVWSDSESGRSTGLFDVLVQDSTLSSQDYTHVNFDMYPNPVNNVLNLKSNRNITSVKVYNLLGQQVLSSIPNKLKEQINLAVLNSGMYLISIEINNHVDVYRIIKQ